MTRRLWVVEQFNDRTATYEPTESCFTSRAYGRQSLSLWRYYHPLHRFRLMEYRPVLAGKRTTARKAR